MTTQTIYTEFPLALDSYNPETGAYQVSLQYSKEFGKLGPVALQLNRPEIEGPLADLDAVQELFKEDQSKFGRQLADRLLPEPIRAKFIEAVQKAGPNQGVRLRLLIRDQELLNIPWEYAYLPTAPGDEDRRHFLALNPKVSVVRHPADDVPPQDLELKDASKVRMVAAMANPDAPGLDKLDLDLEREAIVTALQDFSVEGVSLEWEPLLENTSYDDLVKRLVHKPELFHFSGHGIYLEEDDFGSLVLVEDKSANTAAYLPAQELAALLQISDVRLALLGACESSRVEGRTPWTGVAQAAVAAGVPAVVAMQYEVLNSANTLFSRGFYKALAAGLTVDEAVYYGRLAILSASGEDEMQWGVPTLYLQAWDGVLFPQIARQPPPAAQEVRKMVRLTIGEVEKGANFRAIIAKRIRKDLEIDIKVIAGKARVITADRIEGDVDVTVDRLTGESDTVLIDVDDL